MEKVHILVVNCMQIVQNNCLKIAVLYQLLTFDFFVICDYEQIHYIYTTNLQSGLSPLYYFKVKEIHLHLLQIQQQIITVNLHHS